MISNNEAYRADNTMRELIRDNSLLLMAISRFDIPLGFGDKTIATVCSEHDVDCPTFLAVANFISGRPSDDSHVNVTAMTEYLRRAHSYFLEFILPNIRRKLLDALDCSGADKVALLILKFFDEYVGEVRLHMEYENDTVFVYIDKLLSGNRMDDGFSIKAFAAHHQRMESKLNELKDILIRYCPANNHDMLNSVLFDIINCEQDLASHCSVEDHLLVPAVIKLEKAIAEHRVPDNLREETSDNTKSATGDDLSAREKEIITAIALGMSNKEIADSLCISVHTAATHRRNISTKLGIHSAAGLTIFAIVNKLVDIKDIKSIK